MPTLQTTQARLKTDDLKVVTICLVGPDQGGLLACLSALAAQRRVELTLCTADVQHGRAVLFFSCRGSDSQLDDLCQAIDIAFPADSDDREDARPGVFTGFSVDIRDADKAPKDTTDRERVTLNVVTEDAIGLLAAMTAFLKQQGVDMVYYRAARYYDGSRSTFDSWHEFEVCAVKAPVDWTAFQSRFMKFCKNEFYDYYEVSKPTRERKAGPASTTLVAPQNLTRIPRQNPIAAPNLEQVTSRRSRGQAISTDDPGGVIDKPAQGSVGAPGETPSGSNRQAPKARRGPSVNPRRSRPKADDPGPRASKRRRKRS